MAKKNTESVEVGEALAPVVKRSEALAIADGAKAGDTRGTEGIDNSDVRLPFIAIAQKTSKAIDRSETGKFIKDLEFGQMYNSETREIYGEGPLQFIPVVLRKRAHLLKENGTLGEPVAWTDPRVTWDGARDQGLDKPEGQQIYDWAVLLLPTLELAVISFRSTSFGAGKSLNGFVKMRKPAFAGRYNLAVAIDKNDAGSFGKFLVTPAGKPTDEQFEFADLVYENIKDQNITIAEEASEPAAGGVTDGEVVASQGKKAGDVPF